MRTSRSVAFCILVPLLVALASPVLAAVGPVPGTGPWLQYAEPRLGGFDAGKLDEARRLATEIGSGAVVIVRNGIVVQAWGDIERKFKCHSVRKSFLSALYGNPVSNGTIKLVATVGDLGFDGTDQLTPLEEKATVEQLLQSRSGIYLPAAKEPRSMQKNRPERGSTTPGETFFYNNWDFNAAGAVFEQATGTGIFDAFENSIAGPLGMEDFNKDDGYYQFERRSSPVPAYAFRVSARDAARFGLLYLRDGNWDGKRIVPAEWIRRSFTSHTDLGDGRGYGYMWWIYGPGSFSDHPDLTAYAASGTGGQLIAVMPSLDLVVVHRADTDFARGVPDGEVWRLALAIVDAIDSDARFSRQLKKVEPLSLGEQLPPLSFPDVVTLREEILARYVGEYLVGENLRCELRLLDGILVGWLQGLGETDFFPVSETEFWSRSSGATLSFELAEDGTVSQATFRRRGRDMVAVPVSGQEPGGQPPNPAE